MVDPSERNTQAASRLYSEAFEGGDLELADALVHADARPPRPPRTRTLKEVAAMLSAAFPDEHWDIGELVADGESVAM